MRRLECFAPDEDVLAEIFRVTEEINGLTDVDAILDRILYEARRLSGADAGSIFLREDGQLVFGYVHNDTLFGADATHAAAYSDGRLPIDERSIVGYAALTGETLVIDDAYGLGDSRPYRFNPAWDHQTGYRTTSILTMPLRTFENRLLGVMQLINAQDEEGRVRPFPERCLTFAQIFASKAAMAIERGLMSRELTLRMARMAQMHDPAETGGHVQRVGAISAEIWHRLARKRDVEIRRLKRMKDMIRVAGMLHDVGKVGVSDAILKKPGRLTPEEFSVMQWHTVFGARLFQNPTSELDRVCYDVALNHHQRWDGGGYPGAIPDIESVPALPGAMRSGRDIPLAARIVALADVYDALCARRAYKEAWEEERVMALIESETGRQFDPEVVEAFFGIYDVIKAIREKFKDGKR